MLCRLYRRNKAILSEKIKYISLALIKNRSFTGWILTVNYKFIKKRDHFAAIFKHNDNTETKQAFLEYRALYCYVNESKKRSGIFHVNLQNWRVRCLLDLAINTIPIKNKQNITFAIGVCHFNTIVFLYSVKYIGKYFWY